MSDSDLVSSVYVGLCPVCVCVFSSTVFVGGAQWILANATTNRESIRAAASSLLFSNSFLCGAAHPSSEAGRG